MASPAVPLITAWNFTYINCKVLSSNQRNRKHYGHDYIYTESKMKLSQTYLTFPSLPTATITENHLCPEVKYSVFQPEMWMFWQCWKSIKGEVLFEIVLEPKLFGALLDLIIMEEGVGRCSKATRLPHLTRAWLISWAMVTGHCTNLPSLVVK